MRQYKVDSKFMYWFYVVVMPCLFLPAGVFVIYLAATKPSSGGPLWFWVVWVAFCLYSCHRLVRMAHTIEVADNGLIKFTGLFRRTTVAPQDIVRVKATSGQFLEVKHNGGKIWMLQQITGLHEFLSNLKLANQNVTFKGC
jgi:hypothetical protein